MDVPIKFPFGRQLAILAREDALRELGRGDEVDEGVGQEGYQDFMDVVRQGGKVEAVSEGLDCPAEPWYRRDGKRIVHCSI